jgi:uncharacterized protein (TIGR00730 family)
MIRRFFGEKEHMITSLCVFCGSSPGLVPAYASAARQFGSLIAQRGITLVYGGGDVGLMGEVANGALGSGGKVIGVMPRHLIEKEVAHRNLTELIAVSSMHERKMKMAELSDGFVAMPGGIGTLEEIFEAITWTQLGLQQKPCAFLNTAGFYTKLLAFLEFVVEQRFVKDEHYKSLLVESDGGKLLDRLSAYEHVAIEKWIDRAGRA